MQSYNIFFVYNQLYMKMAGELSTYFSKVFRDRVSATLRYHQSWFHGSLEGGGGVNNIVREFLCSVHAL